MLDKIFETIIVVVPCIENVCFWHAYIERLLLEKRHKVDLCENDGINTLDLWHLKIRKTTPRKTDKWEKVKIYYKQILKIKQ